MNMVIFYAGLRQGSLCLRKMGNSSEVPLEDSDDLSTVNLKAVSPNGHFLVYEIRSEILRD